MQIIKSVTFAHSWTSGKFWVRKRVCSCCWKLMTQEVSVSVCFEPWCQESGTGMRSEQMNGTQLLGREKLTWEHPVIHYPLGPEYSHHFCDESPSVSKLQNLNTRKKTFGQESSLFLFVCIAVLESKPEQNSRACQIKNQNFCSIHVPCWEQQNYCFAT